MAMSARGRMLRDLKANQCTYLELVQQFTAFGNHVKTLGKETFADGFRISEVKVLERAIRFAYCDRKFQFHLEAKTPVVITDAEQIMTGRVAFSEVIVQDEEGERLNSILDFQLNSSGVTDHWESRDTQIMMSDAKATEALILYCLHQVFFPEAQKAVKDADLSKPA